MNESDNTVTTAQFQKIFGDVSRATAYTMMGDKSFKVSGIRTHRVIKISDVTFLINEKEEQLKRCLRELDLSRERLATIHSDSD